MKKVTVLGGGTGTFVVLSGLKQYPIDLAVIVTMMDSGGSTGKLRDQLGVLPPGDIRQCLVALSEAPQLWRELFLYRFENGDLKGHNFGNIFISALEKVTHNYNEVIDTASFVLKTKGKVLPVTFEKTSLNVEYENGSTIFGQGNIEKNKQERSKIKRVFLDPIVKVNGEAINRIRESDYLIIGPGDLYTSIIPILIAGNIKREIKECKAKIVYVMNLMTKAGQTTHYTAADHLRDISMYLGREPDAIAINKSHIPDTIVEWYHSHDEEEVVNDITKQDFKGKVIVEDLIKARKYTQQESDQLVRSILRHDPIKLASCIMNYIEN